MMKKLLIPFIVLISVLKGYSQNSSLDSLSGSYQFQMIEVRGEPSIPVNLEKILKKYRKQDEIVYVKLASDVRIKILPYSVIQKPGYEKLVLVKHINAFETVNDKVIDLTDNK